MQRTRFSDMACSIARTLDVAGEPWSPLIIRDIWVGITRFDDLQRDLGISRKVLAGRLEWLTAQGILERSAYSQRPPRHEYKLTEKGRDFCTVLMAITAWGDRWTTGTDGKPVLLRHRICDQLTTAEVRCSCCGEPLAATDIVFEPGPGASARVTTTN